MDFANKKIVFDSLSLRGAKRRGNPRRGNPKIKFDRPVGGGNIEENTQKLEDSNET